MNAYRKLLVLATNRLIARGHIDLTGTADTQGHDLAIIAHRNSILMWSGIGFEEVRVTIWWDFDQSRHPQMYLEGSAREQFTTSRPLAKRQHYPKFVGAVASGWLERKAGKYLQGKGGQGIFDTYARRGALALVEALPDPAPVGYAAEGRFHL